MNHLVPQHPLLPDHPSLAHPQYRPDIDGLRAIAVLSVVGFHAFPDYVKGGFTGVDIFFVISGFLISTIIFGSLEKSSFSFLAFYNRRIKRIFPALILVLFASYVVGWFGLAASDYQQLGKHIAAGAGFASNFVLWDESGYFDNAAETKPLLHLWSLGIEEQFYIIWPLILWFTWKLRLNLLVITVGIGVISFVLNVEKAGSDVVAAFYSPQTRFWELSAGSVLAYVMLNKQNIFSRFTRSAVDFQSSLGVALIAVGILVITKEKTFPGWWALLPTVGAFLIISAGAQAWLNREVLSSRVLVWFGLISFPLYLWHWPLLAFVRIITDDTPSTVVRIAIVLVSIALAWLTYKLIEQPIRLGKHTSAETIKLVALILIVGYVGYNCYERSGLTFRMANIPSYDWRSGYRYDKCFIDARDATSSSFADSCNGNARDNGQKPLVMLWGDSHAAALYPGLLNQAGLDGYNLAQYTASGCPPVLQFTVRRRKECEHINSFVLEKINQNRPDTLILAARWSIYDGRTEEWELLKDSQIESTILKLKSYNIKHIVLVGQIPTFAGTSFIAKTSSRTFRNFNPAEMETDRRIGSIARMNHIAFVSPLNLLCNASGCLFSTSSERLVPVTWDGQGHLTEKGSDFVIRNAISNNMLALPKGER